MNSDNFKGLNRGIARDQERKETAREALGEEQHLKIL